MGGGANLGTAWIQVKPSMTGVRGSILSGLRGTGSQFGDQMGSEVQKSKGMTVGMAAVWGAASAVALKAIDGISAKLQASIDGAIKRVDTLNNSARTFANMGFDAQTSTRAMDALEKSIKGLPTPLDGAVRGMTSLAATYSDVSLGQKVFPLLLLLFLLLLVHALLRLILPLFPLLRLQFRNGLSLHHTLVSPPLFFPYRLTVLRL